MSSFRTCGASGRARVEDAERAEGAENPAEDAEGAEGRPNLARRRDPVEAAPIAIRHRQAQCHRRQPLVRQLPVRLQAARRRQPRQHRRPRLGPALRSHRAGNATTRERIQVGGKARRQANSQSRRR